MNGVISARHLVTHPVSILVSFGVVTYVRCWQAVLTRKHTTFLALAWR